MNAQADADPETLRISIDTKATVNVGKYSRGGRSRGVEAVKALDHDMCPKKKLVPGGILEPVTGRSFIFFGTSYKTSDFIVDGLFLWWEERKHELCGLKQIVINVETVLKRAGNFFWKGLRTVTRLLDAPYKKGVKVCGHGKLDLEQRLKRAPALHWWDITITPIMVNL